MLAARAGPPPAAPADPNEGELQKMPKTNALEAMLAARAGPPPADPNEGEDKHAALTNLFAGRAAAAAPAPICPRSPEPAPAPQTNALEAMLAAREIPRPPAAARSISSLTTFSMDEAVDPITFDFEDAPPPPPYTPPRTPPRSPGRPPLSPPPTSPSEFSRRRRRRSSAAFDDAVHTPLSVAAEKRRARLSEDGRASFDSAETPESLPSPPAPEFDTAEVAHDLLRAADYFHGEFRRRRGLLDEAFVERICTLLSADDFSRALDEPMGLFAHVIGRRPSLTLQAAATAAATATAGRAALCRGLAARIEGDLAAAHLDADLPRVLEELPFDRQEAVAWRAEIRDQKKETRREIQKMCGMERPPSAAATWMLLSTALRPAPPPDKAPRPWGGYPSDDDEYSRDSASTLAEQPTAAFATDVAALARERALRHPGLYGADGKSSWPSALPYWRRRTPI